MKNVTITMADTVAEWVRLVRQLLAEKMRRDDSYAVAMRDAQKFESIHFEAPPLTRDAIYADRLGRFR